MTTKKIQLPKGQVISPGQRGGENELIDVSGDVEGHGFVNPAPPASVTYRSPSHGGEAVPTDDEGAGPEH
jgi:hypothetical protein